MPRALITGITGQDGRYLAELLTSKGYDVFGMVTGRDNPMIPRVRADAPSLEVVEGDLQDLGSLISLLDAVAPDEVYNLGAASSVGRSFAQPEITADVTAIGALRLLEALRVRDGGSGAVRLYQASSSEMFGTARVSPQDELTPFHPRSPYAVAKVFAHHTTVNYREAYGLHASAGIAFNHESPRRGIDFVTRKISIGVARVRLGLQETIALGNLGAGRDWGFAGDYVEAMWLMLQQPEPDDYVLATGETHTVHDFVEVAFAAAGIDDWARHVVHDPRLLRPADIDVLVGDASKARERLGWKPRVSFPELVRMMVEADLEQEARHDS